VAEWLERRVPECVVWYGGDSSGICAELFDTPARKKLLEHFASENGHEDVVKLLIEKGAKVNKESVRFGKTPLHLAAERGHLEIVERLLAAGADVDYQKYKTPLQVAAEKGQLEVVQLLLEKGADVNKPVIFQDNFHINSHESEKGEYALPPGFRHEPGTALQLASEEGHEEVVSALLKKGANVNQTTRADHTALHFAVENNQLGVIKILLKKGANLKIKSVGKSATDIGKERGFVDAVKMLEKAKLNPKNWL